MKLQLTSSMFPPHAVAILLLYAAAATATATAPINVASSDVAFNRAMDQHKQGHWSDTYRRFSELADEGDPEAARIALLMFRHGSKMYGGDCGASQAQIHQWTKLALQPMDPVELVPGD